MANYYYYYLEASMTGTEEGQRGKNLCMQVDYNFIEKHEGRPRPRKSGQGLDG